MYHRLLCENLLCSGLDGGGDNLRASALGRLAAEIYGSASAPHAGDEEWRLTSPGVLGGESMALSGAVSSPSLARSEHARLVFVNGFFDVGLSSSLSDLRELGVIVSVDEGDMTDDNSIESYRLFFRDLPLAALSVHSARSPLRVSVSAGSENYLQCLFIGDNSGAMRHHGHFIVFDLAEDSRLHLFEKHISASVGPAYTHHDFLRFDLGAGSHLTHHKLQLVERGVIHLGHGDVHLGSGSRYDYGLVHLGGDLGRQDLRVHLCGEGSAAHVRSLLLPLAGMRHHLSTVMGHRVEGCRSDQLVRLISGGGSCGTYQGGICIDSGAVGSVGSQYSRGLLLDRGSVINCKPALEIFADAVECSHGSAIGDLDSDLLFYLSSRGIDSVRGYNLLLQAYVGEVSDIFASSRHFLEFQICLAERLQEFSDFLQSETE